MYCVCVFVMFGSAYSKLSTGKRVHSLLTMWLNLQRIKDNFRVPCTTKDQLTINATRSMGGKIEENNVPESDCRIPTPQPYLFVQFATQDKFRKKYILVNEKRYNNCYWKPDTVQRKFNTIIQYRNNGNLCKWETKCYWKWWPNSIPICTLKNIK